MTTSPAKTRSQIGRRNREKGKDFERWVASEIRSRAPDLDVHRGLQSDGARHSDVVVPGVWIECQDAKVPTPLDKLEQVRRDLPVAEPRWYQDYLQVAICHRFGTPRNTSVAYMPLWSFRCLLAMGERKSPHKIKPLLEDGSPELAAVAVAFPAWIDLLLAGRPWEPQKGDPKGWIEHKQRKKEK